MFWQGGFMFYGSVVVPVGSDILGSHREQGFITRAVTNYLNVGGAVCLVVWAWDLSVGRGSFPGRDKLCWGLWTLLVLTLGVQVWLHRGLDELLDPVSFGISDRHRFRSLHQWYLIVSTLQWAGAVALTAVSLRDDRKLKPGEVFDRTLKGDYATDYQKG